MSSLLKATMMSVLLVFTAVALIMPLKAQPPLKSRLKTLMYVLYRPVNQIAQRF